MAHRDRRGEGRQGSRRRSGRRRRAVSVRRPARAADRRHSALGHHRSAHHAHRPAHESSRRRRSRRRWSERSAPSTHRSRSSACARWMRCSTNRLAGRGSWRSCSAHLRDWRCCWQSLGTYGVLSFMVAERRREIGIRVAVGATRGSIVALVTKQGLVIVADRSRRGLAGALGAEPSARIAAVRRGADGSRHACSCRICDCDCCRAGVRTPGVARLAARPERRAREGAELRPLPLRSCRRACTVGLL